MTALLDDDLETDIDPVAVTAEPPRRRLSDRADLWKGVALFGALAVINLVWWMGAYNYRTLTGDDLAVHLSSNLPDGYASTIRGALTDGSGEQWRPVTSVMLAVATDVFDTEFVRYKLFNLILLTLVCTLVAILVLRLTGGRWLIAAGAALAVLFSRLTAFFVLQGYGIMENTALILTLLTAIAVHWAYVHQRRVGLVAANGFFLLATLTHERFLFLFPFAFLATIWAPVGYRSLRDRLSWASIPVAVVVFNYLAKVWWIDIDFSSSAAGSELDPSPGEVAEFLRSAFLNTIGYNAGPDILSGRDAAALGSTAVALSLALAIPVAVAIVWAVARDAPTFSTRRLDWLRPYALAVALYVPLLLSASIAFRQEFRWLFAPFCILVVGVAWAVSRLPARGAGALLGVVILAASLTVDGYYRQYVDRVYFFDMSRTADSVAERMIDQYRPELASTTFVLVTNGNARFEQGMLAGGRFFDVYAPDSGMDVRFVVELDDVVGLDGLRPIVRVFEWQSGRSSVVSIGGSAF